jgi:hypothetical protein
VLARVCVFLGIFSTLSKRSANTKMEFHLGRGCARPILDSGKLSHQNDNVVLLPPDLYLQSVQAFQQFPDGLVCVMVCVFDNYLAFRLWSSYQREFSGRLEGMSSLGTTTSIGCLCCRYFHRFWDPCAANSLCKTSDTPSD